MRYEVTNVTNLGWITKHEWVGNIFKTNFLCVLVRIAELGVGGDEKVKLDAAIRSLDGRVNSVPGVTCRVWLFVIMEVLVKEGFVRCDGSGEDLEEECKQLGNGASGAAAENQQPRPVVVSSLCG